MGIGNWGSFLDKLISKLPIQNRVERWKNELDSLQKERTRLLDDKATDNSRKRVSDITARIDQLQQLLKNKAND